MKREKSIYHEGAEEIAAFLFSRGVTAVNLNQEASEHFNKAWLKTFASLVKKSMAYIFIAVIDGTHTLFVLSLA